MDDFFANAGRVNTLGGKPIEQADAHVLENGSWNMELNLPRATPTTFLATPIDPDMASSPAAAESPK
jgi:hypothetical protein